MGRSGAQKEMNIIAWDALLGRGHGVPAAGGGGDMEMQGLTSGTFRSITVHPTNTPKATQGCGCSVMRGV